MMNIRCKRQAVDNGVNDLISGLPEHLIDKILERMPIRAMARTSILSRKWRYIWSRHPHLVLDKRFFEERSRRKPYEFMNVVNKILLLHDGPITRFSLYIPNMHYSWNICVDQWLLFLSRNGIKELILDNRYLNPYKLPSSVFSYPELTTLNIRYCVFKPPGDFSGLRNIVNLRFEKITFGSYVFGTQVPIMPLLENLEFTSCNGVEHFKIHGQKLKSMLASNSHNVKSIYLQGISNLSMLSVSLRKETEDMIQGKIVVLSSFLGQLPKLVKLCLDGFSLKLLAPGPVPEKLSITFNHLEHLALDKLRFDDLDQMQCLICLITGSPHLRELNIKAFPVLDNMNEAVSVLEAPGCMVRSLNQLRIVHITCISGLRAELHFIKCILGCSPLLEKMYVHCNGTVYANRGLEIATELMQFIRVSPGAELIYMKSKVF